MLDRIAGAVLGPIRRRRERAEMRALAGGGGAVPAAPLLSGTYITPQTALSLAAVYSAINVISRDLASMPRAVYRRRPGGGREVERGDYRNELLQVAPNDDMDAFSYWQTTLGHVLGWGNGYTEIVRDASGSAVELHLLHPAKTKPRRTAEGRLYYELDNGRKLLPENVLHFSGLGFDGIQGYSPITVCRQTIGLAMGAEQFGASFFGNGAVPKGILRHPKRLSEPAANSLRRSWNEVHQGSQGAHNVAILEEGMDWINTQINPDDGQWLGTREFEVKDIARIYNLPPHKIGDYSESHLANVEEANLDYLATTLGGWVACCESQLNLKLLTRLERRRFEIRFDMTALMRANTEGRQQYYQTMRNMGAMSADDIRIAEGMNPIGPEKGGDFYIVQGQYLPLDQVGAKHPEPDGDETAEPDGDEAKPAPTGLEVAT